LNETIKLASAGVYGVRGAAQPADDCERVLVFDDVRLDRHGAIADVRAA
jgi:hypothetical protein